MDDNAKGVVVYLSVGSNLGDRQANLQAVVDGLPPQVEVLDRSAIYETEPWGYLDQPDFLNQVLMGQTALSPQDLLSLLKKLEGEIGRKPSFRYGPRVVDIDILLYGQEAIDQETLVIPHSNLQERAFVLVPLAELCPGLIPPGTDKTVTELLAGVDASGVSLFSD
jgi:2-amino-4-hydroxy-6-hydroxymethyldihydropteridine diphosphokinase